MVKWSMEVDSFNYYTREGPFIVFLRNESDDVNRNLNTLLEKITINFKSVPLLEFNYRQICHSPNFHLADTCNKLMIIHNNNISNILDISDNNIVRTFNYVRDVRFNKRLEKDKTLAFNPEWVYNTTWKPRKANLRQCKEKIVHKYGKEDVISSRLEMANLHSNMQNLITRKRNFEESRNEGSSAKKARIVNIPNIFDKSSISGNIREKIIIHTVPNLIYESNQLINSKSLQQVNFPIKTKQNELGKSILIDTPHEKIKIRNDINIKFDKKEISSLNLDDFVKKNVSQIQNINIPQTKKCVKITIPSTSSCDNKVVSSEKVINPLTTRNIKRLVADTGKIHTTHASSNISTTITSMTDTLSSPVCMIRSGIKPESKSIITVSGYNTINKPPHSTSSGKESRRNRVFKSSKPKRIIRK